MQMERVNNYYFDIHKRLKYERVLLFYQGDKRTDRYVTRKRLKSVNLSQFIMIVCAILFHAYFRMRLGLLSFLNRLGAVKIPILLLLQNIIIIFIIIIIIDSK